MFANSHMSWLFCFFYKPTHNNNTQTHFVYYISSLAKCLFLFYSFICWALVSLGRTVIVDWIGFACKLQNIRIFIQNIVSLFASNIRTQLVFNKHFVCCCCATLHFFSNASKKGNTGPDLCISFRFHSPTLSLCESTFTWHPMHIHATLLVCAWNIFASMPSIRASYLIQSDCF